MESFIDEVLSLNPRVAAFDCDGTLWDADSGMDFMYWEIEQKLLPSKSTEWLLRRYDEYLEHRVSEEDICGEMAQIHADLEEHEIIAAAQRFFEKKIAGRIFPEMHALVLQLQDRGCEIWAVSSTNEWVVRAGVAHFNIPADRVLGAKVVVENGIITDKLIRHCSGAQKAEALQQSLTSPPDVAFGNSIHDAAMLLYAQHGFAINPTPELVRISGEHGLHIFQPARRRPAS